MAGLTNPPLISGASPRPTSSTGTSQPLTTPEPRPEVRPEPQPQQQPPPPEPTRAAVEAEPATPLPGVKLVLEAAYDPTSPPRLKGRIAAAGQDEELARWNVGGNSDPTYISSRSTYHPGARVVVDVDLKSGGLPKRAAIDRRTGRPTRGRPSQHSVLAHARKWGYWEFRICFEGALRKLPTDHGQTLLRLRVAADGRVTRSKLLKSELADAEAAKCLEDAARNYRAFSPAPGRQLELELSVKLWPGDAPLPALGLSDEQLEIHRKENPGSISAAAFLAALAPAQPQLEACYARGVQRDPALWGRVLLEIQVLAAGGTPKVRERGSRFPDRKVVRCLRRELRKLSFPAPEGGAVTRMLGLRLGAPPEPSE